MVKWEQGTMSIGPSREAIAWHKSEAMRRFIVTDKHVRGRRRQPRTYDELKAILTCYAEKWGRTHAQPVVSIDVETERDISLRATEVYVSWEIPTVVGN